MNRIIELYLITHYEQDKPVREWVDISQYIEQGWTLDDACDGTLDSGKLVFTVPAGIPLGTLNTSEPIPPRVLVRITEPGQTPGVPGVQYVFETSDTAIVPLRLEQQDDKGHVAFLYSYEINLVEHTKELEGKYPPNLSVRQPKNIYDRIFRRSTGFGFTLQQGANNGYVLANGTTRPFQATTVGHTAPDLNNETGIISVNTTSNASVKISTEYDTDGNATTGIALEDYTMSFGMRLASSAPQVVNVKVGAIDDWRFVYATWMQNRPNGNINMTTHARLPITIKVNVKYYNLSNEEIDNKDFSRGIEWTGTEDIQKSNLPKWDGLPIVPIQGFSFNTSTDNAVVIPRNTDAAYAIITLQYATESLLLTTDMSGSGFGGYRDKEFIDLNPNYTAGPSGAVNQFYASLSSSVDKQRVAFRPVQLTLGFTSSAIKESALDSYRTLYDVLDKALQEINLKQRTKYSFSRRLAALLQQFKAPEMTLQDYNFREILVKFCRIAEVVPILGDRDILDDDEDLLTTISFVAPGKNRMNVNIETEDYVNMEKSNTMDEYYDIISARLYNLISEKDWHTETMRVQAADSEYAQITDDTIGFVTTYPIYWLRRLIVKHANQLRLTFTYRNADNQIVSAVCYGNNPNFAPTDAARQSWDLTERCFEEDIYNALPDVNYNTTNGRKGGFLSKANTISYKSGMSMIKNLGHKGPDIPTYDPPYTQTSAPANLAIVEACAVEAFFTWGSHPDYPEFDMAGDLGLTISDILNVSCEISFTPLNEFTYRNTTIDQRKRGHHIEQRVNTQDKVSSYDDTTYYIKAEQNKQGNIVVTPTITYPNIRACIPTGMMIDNNYVVTTRKLKVFDEYVECSYELTKDFVMQNDNIKLNIEFERYAIPFDFVWREVSVYTHVILGYDSGALLNKYSEDAGAINMGTYGYYVNCVVGRYENNTELYGRVPLRYFIKQNGVPIQDERVAIVKLHLLKSSNLVTYIGKFVDNYSAGNQVFFEGNFNYAQPYRYCDPLGKVRKLGLTVYQSINLNLDKFPSAEGSSLNTPMITLPIDENKFSQGDEKDSREGYEFNITASLESSTRDILVYSTVNVINRISIISNDKDTLSQGTTFSDLQFSTTIASELTHTGSFPRHVQYNVIIQKDAAPGVTADFLREQAIALWNMSDDGEPTLKLILRNYTVTEYTTAFYISFYAVASRYGQYPEN